MKKILVAAVVLSCTLELFRWYATADQIPLPAVALNATKTVLNWDWARGGANKPNALGFRVYCGKAVVAPAQQFYDFVDEVPGATARNLLILSHVQSTIKEYGNPVEVKCRVVAYNAAGESADRTSLVPAEPTRVWWTQLP